MQNNNDRYLFRGKKAGLNSGDWIFGSHVYRPELDDKHWIYGENGDFVIVDPATVGQWTGFECEDKDGKIQKVFEGDIFEFDKREWGGNYNIHLVSWYARDGEWSFGGGSTHGDMGWRTLIGNIHDNPELLSE